MKIVIRLKLEDGKTVTLICVDPDGRVARALREHKVLAAEVDKV